MKIKHISVDYMTSFLLPKISSRHLFSDDSLIVIRISYLYSSSFHACAVVSREAAVRIRSQIPAQKWGTEEREECLLRSPPKRNQVRVKLRYGSGKMMVRPMPILFCGKF
jgi:hypothetical protein